MCCLAVYDICSYRLERFVNDATQPQAKASPEALQPSRIETIFVAFAIISAIMVKLERLSGIPAVAAAAKVVYDVTCFQRTRGIHILLRHADVVS